MTHRITVVRSDWAGEGYSEAERTTLGFGIGHDMEFGPEFSLEELWKMVYFFQCNYNALGNPDCVWDVRLEYGEDCETGVNWTEIPPSLDDLVFDMPDLSPNGEDGDYYRGKEAIVDICQPDEEEVSYVHQVDFQGYSWKLLYRAQSVYDPDGMMCTWSQRRRLPEAPGAPLSEQPVWEDVRYSAIPNEVSSAGYIMANMSLADAKQRVEQEAWESKTLAQNK